VAATRRKEEELVGDKPKVAIVGYGKVGRVLARALPVAGYQVAAIVTRQEGVVVKNTLILRSVGELANEVEIVILCLRDEEIAKAVEALPDAVIPAQAGIQTGQTSPLSLIDSTRLDSRLRGNDRIVCHTAGALSAELLAPARDKRWQVMAWHPMMTFTGDEGAELLKDVTFGIDGDEEAVELGEQLARDLGGIPFRVPPELRGTYHLSAVFACNLLGALVGESLDLLEKVGMDQQRAMQAIEPLIKATIESITRKGLSDSITGPIKRGDVAIVSKHLEILSQYAEAEQIYCALSLALLKRIKSSSDADDLAKLLKSPLPRLR